MLIPLRLATKMHDIYQEVLQLLEGMLDSRKRAAVEGEIGEEQLKFRQGRGTIDGMFASGEETGRTGG